VRIVCCVRSLADRNSPESRVLTYGRQKAADIKLDSFFPGRGIFYATADDLHMFFFVFCFFSFFSVRHKYQTTVLGNG